MLATVSWMSLTVVMGESPAVQRLALVWPELPVAAPWQERGEALVNSAPPTTPVCVTFLVFSRLFCNIYSLHAGLLVTKETEKLEVRFLAKHIKQSHWFAVYFCFAAEYKTLCPGGEGFRPNPITVILEGKPSALQSFLSKQLQLYSEAGVFQY